jgi:hypothetical protein
MEAKRRTVREVWTIRDFRRVRTRFLVPVTHPLRIRKSFLTRPLRGGEGRKRVSCESGLVHILARLCDPANAGIWDALVRESTHGVDVLLGDVCTGRESEMSVPRVSISTRYGTRDRDEPASVEALLASSPDPIR